MNRKRDTSWQYPKKKQGKSTALITLALVPLGLLGLGYVACDRDPEQQSFESADEDFGVERTEPGDPEIRPMLASDTSNSSTSLVGPDGQPYDPNRTYEARPTYAWRPMGFFPIFMPMPMWSVPTYRPIYRPGYVGPRYGSSYTRSYRPMPSSSYRPSYSSSGGGSYSRSSGGSSSSSSHSSYSSGTSRGGFGSTSSSHSSSSGS